MSLAVKYRPQFLAEVIGQDEVVKAIYVTGALTHTRLLVGPSGVGKTTIARCCANALCGGKATTSNMVEVDAATNSGAEAMRDIASKAQFRSVGASPIKVIILDESHRLSAAAWASLLKPIEEPPDHVYWFLCSTELGKIPKTIQTRCVLHHLHPVDDVLIYGLLNRVSKAEGLGINSSILEAIAENSEGSPRQALTNLELCLSAKSVDEARHLMRTALQAKEPVDLARLLIGRDRPTWSQVTKIISSMEKTEAESVRIVITNYVAGALMKAKGEMEVKRFLSVLECFSKPYNPSDKLAPLLLSVGLAMGMDQ